MRRPHIRRLSIAVAVTTAATLTAGAAGSALASPASPAESAASAGARGGLSQQAAKSAVAAATKAAVAHAAATGVGKKDKLKAVDALVDANGKQHVRFVRTHQGLPVLGGDLVVHLSAKSAYLGVTRAYAHKVGVKSTRPGLTEGQARQKAAEAAKGEAGEAELVLSARESGTALAYRVQVGGSGSAEGGLSEVVLDAATGRILSNAPVDEAFLSPAVKEKLRAQGDTVDPQTVPAKGAPTGAASVSPRTPADFPSAAKGEGTSFFVGKVQLSTTQTAANSYTLKDSTRGGTETRDAGGAELEDFAKAKAFTDKDNKWGDGSVKDPATAAVDAQYGITNTLDFYRKTLGRKGIKNDGKGAHALVHYGDKVGNAFWSPDCACMLYGDGDGKDFTKPLVVLDVTGHELTHGVVEATAALEPTRVDGAGTQYGEPGALNESLADIFGANVEFSTGNKSTPPNYLIGEQLGLEQKFLRRLDKPSLDKLEGTIDYWSKDAYDTEVHAGSGVSSLAYYLLAEGSGKKTIGTVDYDAATHDGSQVTGIGRDKATKIFYQALTRYMVSTTDFHQARKATLSAAADLYGKDSTEYKTVDAAWSGVNVTAANTPKAPKASKAPKSRTSP
ncbi:M4 family metallopeptidase [Streptomyces sp. SCSIO ZS0520]|uniref:M4 family metallopeptidase n=1 Tax=Streptomyces sp. SCSIO ZS0520 TaxID=2892996 RepID=UPI0021D8FCF3|nr:M4 family metallopeptidase [Streptomyces sp. SCSIO ZS0520]